MTTLVTAKNAYPRAADQKAEAQRIMVALEELCHSEGVGGRLPRHTELMRTLGASERNVLRALDELHRRGRVIRRHGAGTFVADGLYSAAAKPASIKSKSIVAVALPDKSIFDKCLELLYEETANADINLICQVVGENRIGSIDPSSFGQPIGFLLFRRTLAGIAKKLQDLGHRVVLVGAPLMHESLGVATVCGNQELGGYLSVKHLVELGHRRIAFYDESGNLENHPRWQGCLRAFREAQRYGVSVTHSIFSRTDYERWNGDSTSFAAHFMSLDGPTAIAAWNDTDALALLANLRRAGVSVPEQVSVIGYDNLEAGRQSHPSLSTIDHQIEQQVSAALSLLLGDEPLDSTRTIVFAPTLLARESTARPRTTQIDIINKGTNHETH